MHDLFELNAIIFGVAVGGPLWRGARGGWIAILGEREPADAPAKLQAATSGEPEALPELVVGTTGKAEI